MEKARVPEVMSFLIKIGSNSYDIRIFSNANYKFLLSMIISSLEGIETESNSAT